MICCNRNLKIVQTIHMGGLGKTKTGKCLICGKKYSIIEAVVNEVKKRGDGARALANRLKEDRDG